MFLGTSLSLSLSLSLSSLYPLVCISQSMPKSYNIIQLQRNWLLFSCNRLDGIEFLITVGFQALVRRRKNMCLRVFIIINNQY
jgi:hypothetical protein